VPGLTRDEIDRLATGGRIQRIGRREVVPLDGPTIMLVCDGWFRVFRNAAFVRDVTLFIAQAGDVIAPGALFGERSAESGAEALADATVLSLTREAFDAVAGDDPRLYVSVAANLGRRVTRVQTKLEAFSRATVESRVARALLDIAEDFGVPAPAGTRIDIPLSQSDLASLAGTTRESCSQTVAALARAGILKGGRIRGLVIQDRTRLEALLA